MIPIITMANLDLMVADHPHMFGVLDAKMVLGCVEDLTPQRMRRRHEVDPTACEQVMGRELFELVCWEIERNVRHFQIQKEAWPSSFAYDNNNPSCSFVRDVWEHWGWFFPGADVSSR
jgi:hypothetical protein